MTISELVHGCFGIVQPKAVEEVIEADAEGLVTACINILSANRNTEGLHRKLGAFHIIEYLWNEKREILGDADQLRKLAEALAVPSSDVGVVHSGHSSKDLSDEIKNYTETSNRA